MKTPILPLIFLCILIIIGASTALGQQAPTPTDEPKTKLEIFQRQKGVVVVKGYQEMGKMGGDGYGIISLTAMEFTDAGTQIKQKGIVIEITEEKKYGKSDQSFIDYEEIDPLLSGIEYVLKITEEITELDNFEAIYSTKGDLSVVTFNGSTKVKAAVRSGRFGATTAYLSLDQLTQFKNLIILIQKKLASLKK